MIPKFKVGDKVTLDEKLRHKYVDNNDIMEKTKYPYLTICKINNRGHYITIEDKGGLWTGVYWKLYKNPDILPEDLFTI